VNFTSVPLSCRNSQPFEIARASAARNWSGVPPFRVEPTQFGGWNWAEKLTGT
jgi:hypothetical protein